jgi:hypothetical protein
MSNGENMSGFENEQFNRHRMTLAALICAILAGCATSPPVLERVGPGPPKIGGAIGNGWLIVYSATRTVPDGGGTFSYPHTGYRIYTDSGKFWKYVHNRMEETDRTPTTVVIPAGDYKVHALSDFGPVVVPVRISPGRATEVKLDFAGTKPGRRSNDVSLVWTPKELSTDPYAVGWRAEQ